MTGMALQDANQVGDIAAIVVDHLGPGPRGAAQEDAAHPDERFGIGLAGRGVQDGADPAGEVAFAAQPGGDGQRWQDGGEQRRLLWFAGMGRT